MNSKFLDALQSSILSFISNPQKSLLKLNKYCRTPIEVKRVL